MTDCCSSGGSCTYCEEWKILGWAFSPPPPPAEKAKEKTLKTYCRCAGVAVQDAKGGCACNTELV